MNENQFLQQKSNVKQKSLFCSITDGFMYLCVKGINFASFYDFSIVF